MIEHEKNHVQTGLDLLLYQFKDKPNIEAFLTAILNQVQDIEDATRDVLLSRIVDNAEGEQLNIIGRRVGQERGNLDDATYRLYIKARTMLNRSHGRPDDLLSIVSVLVGGEPLAITEHPKYVQLTAETPITAGGEAIASILREGKAAGVRSVLHWHSDADVFQFSASGAVVTDAAHGFGDDTSTTTGGVMAAASEG